MALTFCTVSQTQVPPALFLGIGRVPCIDLGTLLGIPIAQSQSAGRVGLENNVSVVKDRCGARKGIAAVSGLERLILWAYRGRDPGYVSIAGVQRLDQGWEGIPVSSVAATGRNHMPANTRVAGRQGVARHVVVFPQIC